MNTPREPDDIFEDRLRSDLHRVVKDSEPSPFLRQRVERAVAGQRLSSNRKAILAVAASVALLAVAASVIVSGRSPDAQVYAGQDQHLPATTPSSESLALAVEPAPDSGGLNPESPPSIIEDVPDGIPVAPGPVAESPGDALAAQPPPTVLPPSETGPGRIAYVSSVDGGPTDIYVMNEDGSDQTKVTNANATFEAEAPAWSADRTRIAFTGVSEETGVDVYVINADGTGQMRLTDVQGAEASPAWSPDGTKIAYYRGEVDGTSGIWITDSDGSGSHRLSDFGEYPTWSPDGSSIAFSSNTGERGVFVMDADGSDQRRLTTNDYALGPDWSPDGRQIAFHSGGNSETNQSGNISVVNADGSGERVITTALYYYGPSWSPESTRLVVAENCRLYMVAVDGSSRHELTTTGTCAEDPAWTS
ncbi:MAG TPA: hypothetical protein VGV93_08810 [Acidimicrobiales bacterium]|nr:hypothetical protein [Acidimicrobiales bacterium]